MTHKPDFSVFFYLFKTSKVLKAGSFFLQPDKATKFMKYRFYGQERGDWHYLHSKEAVE